MLLHALIVLQVCCNHAALKKINSLQFIYQLSAFRLQIYKKKKKKMLPHFPRKQTSVF